MSTQWRLWSRESVQRRLLRDTVAMIGKDDLLPNFDAQISDALMKLKFLVSTEYQGLDWTDEEYLSFLVPGLQEHLEKMAKSISARTPPRLTADEMFGYFANRPPRVPDAPVASETATTTTTRTTETREEPMPQVRSNPLPPTQPRPPRKEKAVPWFDQLMRQVTVHPMFAKFVEFEMLDDAEVMLLALQIILHALSFSEATKQEIMGRRPARRQQPPVDIAKTLLIDLEGSFRNELPREIMFAHVYMDYVALNSKWEQKKKQVASSIVQQYANHYSVSALTKSVKTPLPELLTRVVESSPAIEITARHMQQPKEARVPKPVQAKKPQPPPVQPKVGKTYAQAVASPPPKASPRKVEPTPPPPANVVSQSHDVVISPIPSPARSKTAGHRRSEMPPRSTGVVTRSKARASLKGDGPTSRTLDKRSKTKKRSGGSDVPGSSPEKA